MLYPWFLLSSFVLNNGFWVTSSFLFGRNVSRRFLKVSTLLPNRQSTTNENLQQAHSEPSRLVVFSQQKNRQQQQQQRSRSRVEDPDGPTPTIETDDIEALQEIPDELREMMRETELPQPIPYQSWRRGDTAGCEAPIAAEWRRDAEDTIKTAVECVRGRVLDITWFLTAVLVTLDDEHLPEPSDLITKARGVVVDIVEPDVAQYKHPSDPNPEEIWDDEDEILYQRETPEEMEEAKQRKIKSYAPKDPDDPPDEPHIQDQIYYENDGGKDEDDDSIPLFKNEETRDEVAIRVTEEEQLRYEESEKPIDLENQMRINTSALSVIAQAILDSLEEREDELKILQRHELVLTSPGPPDVIETQRQFDAHRGLPVIVETQDPFDSNRTLKGRLVDRILWT